MRTPSRTAIRAFLVAVLLVTGGTVLGGYAAASADTPSPGDAPRATASPSPTTETSVSTTDGRASNAETAAPQSPSTVDLESKINRSNVTEAGDVTGQLTVVATQGFYVSDENAELVAFSEDGSVVYHDDTYKVYFDVDPVPGAQYTVEYVAAKHLPRSECDDGRCTRNVVKRVNLTTGEESTVYARKTPRIYSARWHDADRLNDTHLVVADIVNDGVYAVDTRTNETVWRWNATDIYTPEMGGKEGDWTHINDVEVLPDGRVMVSVRNMDQVVFLAPDAGRNGTWGAQESWSLGTDDRHSVLFEQHNPDYIPASRGGPAVLVADSENGRVVEYERSNETWNRTWGWTDARLQWPRDADRLPSGNTLVVDSHGDRVLEVRPDGRIEWSVTVGMPYDAERLGTGDESAGGESMSAIQSRQNESNESGVLGVGPDSIRLPGGSGDGTVVRPPSGPAAQFWLTLKSVLPPHVVNGLLYMSPSGIQFSDLVFAAVFLLTGLVWGGLELRWSSRRPLAAVRRRLGRVRR